ncbi:hypothetical protein AZI87_05305 [Bdellovibrio bacteriovorus]|uniref:Endonuclease/exonuclease/phosphatase domain-containing protein n=1 Tax=Bdellovibrio bacteriovorus TaxID=959 RepID=A0A162GPT4_BDEBC|nr:endonuclease/exonuclease/phosphatase family protein [Bdellovibrio bacteriovorus]KYG68653.1 hypothetical protein AZI87_05305 [Bdellovibrio bacteriovorus]
MMQGWILALAVLLGTSAYAYEIPSDSDVMTHFGDCKAEFLPSNFSIFVWNIKKAESKARWAMDFERFAPKSDVVLIQEAMLDTFVTSIALRQKNFCWDFATSFIDNDPTGVMNGSPITALKTHFLRSPGREPIARTPKMTLIAEFAIANSRETLMVANIHALNFVQDKNNRAQIQAVADFLKKHKGPIIFAGDFNSWNGNRTSALNEILSPLGLKKIPLDNDDRGMKLDHIFVRGLLTHSSTLHPDIKSSDHAPITAAFRLK